MSNVIFTYNEEAALTAGQGGFINETGAHIITITEAELRKVRISGEILLG
ncbi:hypothetical protein FSF25_026180 [Escherichia coli]|nr:hypothetical protein [Escherichia coli]